MKNCDTGHGVISHALSPWENPFNSEVGLLAHECKWGVNVPGLHGMGQDTHGHGGEVWAMQDGTDLSQDKQEANGHVPEWQEV